VRQRAALPAGRLEPEAAGQHVAALFSAHGRMVFGLCGLLLRDQVEAEDAAQQAFLSAHRALLAGQRPRDSAAWLAAIARNECRRRIRSRMREPLFVSEAQLPTGGEAFEETIDRREQFERLRAAVAELPENQREAVVLRDFLGLRYAEVGAAMGTSRAAVESLLFRARNRLRGRLRAGRRGFGGLVVPVAVQDALERLVPGFATESAGAGGAVVGAAGLAKLLTTPTAAKVAVATLAIGAVGTTGVVHSSRQRLAGMPREQAAGVVPLAPRTARPLPASRTAPRTARREERADGEHSRRRLGRGGDGRHRRRDPVARVEQEDEPEAAADRERPVDTEQDRTDPNQGPERAAAQVENEEAEHGDDGHDGGSDNSGPGGSGGSGSGDD
jgi:RNA polymerase sigma factor (sigma-70 family)